MGNLVNALNELKTNIFGGGQTSTATPILRQSAIEMKDTSPTSRAGVDPFSFASISYPRDVTNDLQNGHYMLFYINVQNKTKYRYTDPFGKKVGGDTFKTTINKETGEYSVERSKGVGADLQDKLALRKLREGYSNNDDVAALHKSKQKRATGLSSVLPTTTRISDSVALYLPPNVQDSTSAGYTDANTGMVGFAVQKALISGAEFGNRDYEGTANSVIDAFRGLGAEAVKKAITGFAETLTETEGAAGLFNKTFGQADNPFMEVLFDKMAMRNFTYNFTFAPKNKDERDDVQKIIALFRFHMAPELQGQAARFLTLPSEFDIHYMYQSQSGQASENDYYNKIATCVLTDCSVDYTPGGVRSFDDGSPTQIKMSLSFMETQLLTKELIAQGY